MELEWEITRVLLIAPPTEFQSVGLCELGSGDNCYFGFSVSLVCGSGTGPASCGMGGSP